MNRFDAIVSMAESMLPEMTATRQDFHKHAETGWLEMRTSSIIARKLTDLGYKVLVGEDVCDRDARMGVPSDEVLEVQYQRAVEQGAAEALCSDKVLADRVAAVAREIGMDPNASASGSGSEDFSYMMNRVQQNGGQAVFFRTLTKISGTSHGRYYDFNEEVLVKAVKVFCCTVADIMV